MSPSQQAGALCQGKYGQRLVMYLAGHTHPLVAREHYNKVIQKDLATGTLKPLSGAISGESRGKPSKEKDAESVETAS